jgi:cysteinyl-tRNA synthetase
MLSCTRELDGQTDKHSAVDFALWKKASPEHIMRWPSPWSEGFPGWHMECSAMSLKYLGERFDIHGGGMDLVFPHHEAEMAQGTAAACGCGCEPHGESKRASDHPGAKYWMHNNMITIDGRKMGKSLGNFITLEQMFTGSHPLLTQAYSPMTIRFFMLTAHYRSTLDFGNEALQAAEKGLDRLMKAVETLEKITPTFASAPASTSSASTSSASTSSAPDPAELETRLGEAMDDDLNSPLAIAALFDWVRVINSLHDGSRAISADHLEQLRAIFHRWVFEILGLNDEKAATETNNLAPVMELLLELRRDAKENKNWALSDKIRDGLAAAGIKVMDKKDGTSEWEVK